MRKKVLAVLFISVLVLAAGCSKNAIRDNQVYTAGGDRYGAESILTDVRIDTEGLIPFREFDYSAVKDIGIPVTVSPDGKSVYLMQQFPNHGEKVIKGEDFSYVDLIRYDVQTKNQTVLGVGIPFISEAKWNKAGDKVAFLSNQNLHIYDTVRNKVDADMNLPVSHFEWSPDGNKIYTEHPNLANGSIVYAGTGKVVRAYDSSNEDTYVKGILDKEHYYGTKIYLVEQQIREEMGEDISKEEIEKLLKQRGKTQEIKTVIIDINRNVVKELPEGRFRASYKRAMLQTSLSGFGLSYFPDINSPEIKTLTGEYVYDAKFIRGGRIIYTTKDTNAEENNFVLHIADSQGNKIKNLVVSSSRICLSPDGKIGYGTGPDREVVKFEELLAGGKGLEIPEIQPAESQEHKEIYRAVRGAMDAYYKSELVKGKDESGIARYFTDSSNPEQWGYFDVLTKVRERKYSANADFYTLHIYWKDYENTANFKKPTVLFSPMSDRPRASANISISAHNSFGSGMGMEHALELIKKEDGKWYVTGLSTFPYSAKARELRQKAEQSVKEIQDKGLYGGVLKGKQVKVGQVQFWRLSEPHLSPDVDTANYCKVYLKVSGNGKEEIYKLVLDRKNQNYWKVNTLNKEHLSGL